MRMLGGKANSRSQWFLSLYSVTSGLEKPLLATGGVCSVLKVGRTIQRINQLYRLPRVNFFD